MITWSGTDRNNKSLISSVRKFTAYKKFGLKERFEGFIELNEYTSE